MDGINADDVPVNLPKFWLEGKLNTVQHSGGDENVILCGRPTEECASHKTQIK